jgi:taurine dioxygenase
MADTPDHTNALMEGAGARIQGQQWAMEQPVTMLESRDVIGADVYGVDLSQPLSPVAFATIETAFHKRAVLCLRQQRVTAQQFIDFARRFGEVERIFLTHYAHPQHPEIMLVSNIQDNGRPIGHADAGRVWHTDMSYTARPPRVTMLYALEVPMENGAALGATHFASAAAAYAGLPEALQTRLEGLRAVHRVAGRRARTGTGQQDQALRTQQPDVVHPVVRTHPYTGQQCLYVTAGECGAIEGMATDEALALIEELATWVLQPQFRHVHTWQTHDLLMWDNCSVQHLATFDYQWPQHRRLMHRITVGGSIPY